MDTLLGLAAVIVIIGTATVLFMLLLRYETRVGPDDSNRVRRGRGGPQEIDAAIRHWDRVSSFHAPFSGGWSDESTFISSEQRELARQAINRRHHRRRPSGDNSHHQ